eukprot:131426_1
MVLDSMALVNIVLWTVIYSTIMAHYAPHAQMMPMMGGMGGMMNPMMMGGMGGMNSMMNPMMMMGGMGGMMNPMMMGGMGGMMNPYMMGMGGGMYGGTDDSTQPRINIYANNHRPSAKSSANKKSAASKARTPKTWPEPSSSMGMGMNPMMMGGMGGMMNPMMMGGMGMNPMMMGGMGMNPMMMGGMGMMNPMMMGGMGGMMNPYMMGMGGGMYGGTDDSTQPRINIYANNHRPSAKSSANKKSAASKARTPKTWPEPSSSMGMGMNPMMMGGMGGMMNPMMMGGMGMNPMMMGGMGMMNPMMMGGMGGMMNP